MDQRSAKYLGHWEGCSARPRGRNSYPSPQLPGQDKSENIALPNTLPTPTEGPRRSGFPNAAMLRQAPLLLPAPDAVAGDSSDAPNAQRVPAPPQRSLARQQQKRRTLNKFACHMCQKKKTRVYRYPVLSARAHISLTPFYAHSAMANVRFALLVSGARTRNASTQSGRGPSHDMPISSKHTSNWSRRTISSETCLPVCEIDPRMRPSRSIVVCAIPMIRSKRSSSFGMPKPS